MLSAMYVIPVGIDHTNRVAIADFPALAIFEDFEGGVFTWNFSIKFLKSGILGGHGVLQTKFLKSGILYQ